MYQLTGTLIKYWWVWCVLGAIEPTLLSVALVFGSMALVARHDR